MTCSSYFPRPPILLFALLITRSLLLVSAEQYRVSVYGYISPIVIKCVANGKTFGPELITDQKIFRVPVDVDQGNGESSYVLCDIKAPPTQGRFSAFRLFECRRDCLRCPNNNCIWQIRADGLHTHFKDGQDFFYPWP